MSQSQPENGSPNDNVLADSNAPLAAKRKLFSKTNAVIGLGCVGGILAIVIYSNLSRSSTKTAVLPPAPGMVNVQGSTPVTPLYAAQRTAVDKQNYTQAVQQGTSSFPLPEFNPQTGTDTSPNLGGPGGSNTPPPALDTEDASTTSVTPPANTTQQSPAETTAGNDQNDPEASALAALLGPEVPQHQQQPGGISFVGASDLQFKTSDQPSAAGNGSGGATGQALDIRKYVPAPGTLLPAELINGLNSDAPGAAFAFVTSGPLHGARVIGNFQTGRGGLVLKFTTMTVPIDSGASTVTVPIEADAISETGDEVPADVNNHFLQNAAVTFIAGFGQSLGTLLEQSGSTTVNTGTGFSVTQNPSLTLGTELGAAAGGAVGAVGNQFQQSFGSRPPTIKIDPGTDFTLAFLGNDDAADQSTGGVPLQAIKPSVGGLPNDAGNIGEQMPTSYQQSANQ